MAYDDAFTSEEQTAAEELDLLIEERLRTLPFLPPDQRPASDSLLIQNRRASTSRRRKRYKPACNARARVEHGVAHPLTQHQRKRMPLAQLRSLRERRDHMNHRWSLFRAARGSSRLVALVAALLMAVLIGGLVTSIILVPSHGTITAHPTQSTTIATLAPGPTQKPSPGPTQTPGGAPGVQGLVSIHMLDVNNGWAITGQNHILRTTDGANHWQDVTPPSIDPPEADYSNLAYDFLSPSVAWVSSFIRDANDTGGTTKYYRTTNGGQLWLSMMKQGDVPTQITFTDSKGGWMFSFLGVASGSSGADIFRTSDGGATWTKVASASPSTASQPGALPFDGDKTGMGARDAMTAWVTGTNANPSFVWLYVTHDGGATWQHQTLPLPSSFSGQVITKPPTFFNAQDGILPVLFLGAGSEDGATYVTHDGGATWQSTPRIEAGEFDFINANWGWATNGSATGGSTLYATSDGGQHWTKLPTTPNFHDIDVLDFVSAQIGWAIVLPQVTPATTLLKTTDGGQTWTGVPFPHA